MKFLKTLYNYTHAKVNSSYQFVRKSAGKILTTAQKLKHLTLPYLKTMNKEILSMPVSGLKIRKSVAIAASYIGIHVLEYGITYYFSTSAVSPNNESEEQTSGKPLIVQTTKAQLILASCNIIVATSLFAAKRFIAYYVRDSVEKPLKKKLAKDWLSNNASNGITFLQEIEGNEMPPVADIFSNHIAMSTKGISLALNITSDAFTMITQLYFIKKLFNNLKLLAFLSGYGLTIVGLRRVLLSNAYERLFGNISKKSADINARITNIQQFSMQTICSRGEAQEFQKIAPLFEVREELSKQLVWFEIQESSTFQLLQNITNALLDFLFPELSNLTFYNRRAAYFYRQIFNEFIEKLGKLSSYLTQEIPPVSVSIDHVVYFKSLLTQWNKFTRLKLLEQEFLKNNKKSKREGLSLHQFKLHISKKPTEDPEDNPKKDILHNIKKMLENPNLLRGEDGLGVSIVFKKGYIYLFNDHSGTGKTTFLRAILGMYPLACGKVRVSSEPKEICFISRNTFVPAQKTLLEIIAAPDEPSKESAELARVYIDKVGFGKDAQKFKDSLFLSTDWSRRLSDGEKQRFAIIGVLMRKPKVLILDEALGNLDITSKILLETIIKEELINTKNTTIFYADHHPIPGFADVVVEIKNGKLICTPENQYDYPYLKRLKSGLRHRTIDSKNDS